MEGGADGVRSTCDEFFPVPIDHLAPDAPGAGAVRTTRVAAKVYGLASALDVIYSTSRSTGANVSSLSFWLANGASLAPADCHMATMGAYPFGMICPSKFLFFMYLKSKYGPCHRDIEITDLVGNNCIRNFNFICN